MELFQIWLNLPAKDKFVNAHFKMLWGDDIPKESSKDENGKETMIEIVAAIQDLGRPYMLHQGKWFAVRNAGEVTIGRSTALDLRGVEQFPDQVGSAGAMLASYRPRLLWRIVEVQVE